MTIENQFQKGISGNPSGRPKGALGIKGMIKKLWEAECKDKDGNDSTEGKEISKAIIKKAKSGDVSAFKALSERMEGMPKQEMDLNANVTKMDKIMKDGVPLDFQIGDHQGSNEEENEEDGD